MENKHSRLTLECVKYQISINICVDANCRRAIYPLLLSGVIKIPTVSKIINKGSLNFIGLVPLFSR